VVGNWYIDLICFDKKIMIRFKCGF
jgi:hypothetical protein